MTPASTTPADSWINAITPHWLTTVLRAAAVAEAAVLDIETRPLGVASAAGDLARLSMAYEPMRPPGPDPGALAMIVAGPGGRAGL